MMKKITIVIVDDHILIRQMWKNMFANNKRMEITGKSGTVNGAIEMVKIKKPDIVLLDINLASESGMDAVPLIRKFSPGTRIIAVSAHTQPALVKKILRLGARGYVTKNSPFEEIVKAIEEVMKGEMYVCAEIKDFLSDLHLNTEPDRFAAKDLTLREIEIIKLIKDGFSSKEISLQLSIAIRTTEVHRHHILKKLGLKNIASLINFIGRTDLNFLS